MREILFRGFTPIENGKEKAFVNNEWIKGQWVQGSYWKLNKTTYCFKEDYESDPNNTKHYIVFDQMTDWGLPNRHLQADVIPETVGQYTGLTDKNGTKIFEGDIVKTSHWNGFIEWNDFDASFVVHCVGTFVTQNTLAGHATLEVIGNIHDNPELLKGGVE